MQPTRYLLVLISLRLPHEGVDLVQKVRFHGKCPSLHVDNGAHAVVRIHPLLNSGTHENQSEMRKPLLALLQQGH